MPKPWAIVGTGPCAADVDDWERLARERQTLAMNAAIEKIPRPDAYLLHDAKAALRHLGDVNPPTRLVFTDLVEGGYKSVYIGPVGVYERLPMDEEVMNALFAYEPHTHMRRIRGGSLPQAIKYLAGEGVREIELYGIDLNSRIYENQIQPTRELVSEFRIDIRVCCPSSSLPKVFPGIAVESRPWSFPTAEVA